MSEAQKPEARVLPFTQKPKPKRPLPPLPVKSTGLKISVSDPTEADDA